ncbi:hypothetical protein ACS8FD_08195 [Psychrobacter sp. 1U2]|uniref:hypothetical protein n=1 Tax=Psychrobacter sp. 1U2 TaxID=3453577 RepID=UPI003F44B505
MTIIEQLEQSVSLPLLGAEQDIARISLLEQFYALLIARLTLPKVYTQLLQAAPPLTAQAEQSTSEVLTATELSTVNTVDRSLFSQLWPDPDQRELIIDELAATHHLDKSATAALITSASALAYHELKTLADGQFLPAFLQQQQLDIRHYLPVWAESVLTEQEIDSGSNWSSHSVSLRSDLNADEVTIPTTMEAGKPIATTATKATVNASEQSAAASHIAIDDSAHSHSHSQFRRTRKRNNRQDLLWRLLLLAAAIAALALVWVLVIQPNYISTTTTAEPVSVEPDMVIIDPEPVAAVLTPAELLIAVDNSGRLYTCNGIVGSSTLQDALSQALVSSFGEEASICELQLKSGVADSLTAVNVELLPSLFTLLKSAPFARLQLQNDIIIIESPDDSLSQRLLTDMRALVPTANITTNASFSAIENPATSSEEEAVLADNSEWQNEAQENDNFNPQPSANDSFNNNANPNTNNANNTVSSNVNNNANNSTYNGVNPKLDTNPIANTGAIGRMSTAEVDDLANSVIVAERLDNESRVE